MRSEAPARMPIFRSQHRAALLAWLLLHPDDEYTLTELAKELGVPLTTLQREAQCLLGAGILQDRTLGRARLLRANLTNRAAAPITQLLEVHSFCILGPGRQRWERPEAARPPGGRTPARRPAAAGDSRRL